MALGGTNPIAGLLGGLLGGGAGGADKPDMNAKVEELLKKGAAEEQQRQAKFEKVSKSFTTAIQKYAPYLGEDAKRAALELLMESVVKGEFNPAKTSRMMVQIEASANNLSPQYVLKLLKLHKGYENKQLELKSFMDAITQKAEMTGKTPPEISQLKQDSQKLQALSKALHANLQLAKTNPAAAMAELDAALGTKQQQGQQQPGGGGEQAQAAGGPPQAGHAQQH